MNDPVRRAYARLGLPANSSPEAVRRRFRTLVRRWHPDRFASDPLGQREATERMAQLNHDYRLLSRSLVPTPNAAPTDAPVPRPLSRIEVDALVEAIGTEGPIDHLFGELDYFYFFWRHAGRSGRPSGRVVLASLTAVAGLGAFWAGWMLATRPAGRDALSWFMFGASAVLLFVAGIEVRELLKERRSGP